MTNNVSLDDRYLQDVKRLYLNGTQAIVRLLLLQHWQDQARGLNTGGFVSGYRGSPLAGVDQALWQGARHLLPKNIHFKPAINEELGATAVWGSQQVGLFPGATTQGVYSLWYGKGPGVDRSGDAFKHGNAAGTSPHGGVLVLAGDDHLAKSSSLPHQSEYALIDAGIPILHPSSVQEILTYGLFGWALSRYSGCWAGLKLTADIVDITTSIDVEQAPQFIIPPDFVIPSSGVHIRWPDTPLAQEKRLLEVKLPAAQAFAYHNNIDVIKVSTPKDVCGIVTTGKAYQDVRQALTLLGLGESEMKALGIRLYKVGLTWPLEPRRAQEFAKGLKAILVVEEKRPVIEEQLKSLLFNTAGPKVTIIGKHDLDHQLLLPAAYELNPLQVAQAIAALLGQVGQVEAVAKRLAALSVVPVPALMGSVARIPFYCSGCPHNTSSKTLPGSRTLAGIGCHYMAMWIDDGTATFSQMGGEGVAWVGQSPFTTTEHVFANLGDGTYLHSGSLAIRASVAAGVNITYKILFNDAVAMTGGQPMDGFLTPSEISLQLHGEGVKTIAVVSDEPDKYPIGTVFAPHTTFHHRRDLTQVEERLKQTPGVSVIIYDQTCAAEKRRRRKRKLMVDPPKRVFINELVCEGCGDCGKASSCLSIIPKETEFGRKRSIDQSSCNKDFSCLEGFCPSFVTVEGGKYTPVTVPLDRTRLIPAPEVPALRAPYGIVISGIGGTGVVTIGALLTMAAHIEGKHCSALDMTGLSQKGGAVTSHVKIAPANIPLTTARLERGTVDVVLGADALVTAQDVLPLLSKEKSHVILNDEAIATGQFTKSPDEVIPVGRIMDQVTGLLKSPEHLHAQNFSALSLRLFGDLLPTNMIILGYAFQKGLIPLSWESLETAIALNAASQQMNLDAFYTGRRTAFDPAWAQKICGADAPAILTLDETIAKRALFLTDYQNAKYAEQYKTFVTRVRAFEQKTLGQEKLTWAVAKYLFKVMAYKDEYEVARLYTDTTFIDSVKAQIKGDAKIHVHLAPPLLAEKDPLTGHLRKASYGPWVLKAFKHLAKLKGLRGTVFDPLGFTAERKAERKLIADYQALLEQLMEGLAKDNTLDRYALALELASLPESVRGFGHVKEANLKQTYEKWAGLMKLWG
jgi:indolepyruvate ferredoxin oxidoreductase